MFFLCYEISQACLILVQRLKKTDNAFSLKRKIWLKILWKKNIQFSFVFRNKPGYFFGFISWIIFM